MSESSADAAFGAARHLLGLKHPWPCRIRLSHHQPLRHPHWHPILRSWPMQQDPDEKTSHFLGIPVPVLGLLYFVPMTILCLFPRASALRRQAPHWARLSTLDPWCRHDDLPVIEELFIIRAFCIWCSIIHVVGFLLFVIIVTTAPVASFAAIPRPCPRWRRVSRP